MAELFPFHCSWPMVRENNSRCASGDQTVTFNDPYPPKGGKDIRVSHEDFQRMLDDIGTRIGLSPSVLFVRQGPSLP